MQTPDLGALRTLLAAGQADGSIRSDLTAEDVFLLLGFLWRLDRTPDRAARAERMLDAVMRGLQVIDNGPSADERTANDYFSLTPDVQEKAETPGGER